MQKRMLAIWGLLCLFAGPIHGAAAAYLPAIGDTKSAVEAQYGPMVVVQENDVHFWLDRQWVAQNKVQAPAKAFGYPISVQGVNAMLWIEYDQKDRVRKETILWDGSLKIRNFGHYFPELHAAITKKDSVTAVIRSYPRDQLAVRTYANERSERWVRFLFTGDDQTCINMHSKIRGFEITESSPGAFTGRMKSETAVGCRFNGNIADFPTDGTWQKTDNYFLAQLFFSERLIPRRGTDLIVIHHAAMPIDTSRADIHELHLTNEWAGIGYHKLVFANGTIENGRPEQVVGAHAYGANRRSLGIVLVGDFSKVQPEPFHLEQAARLTLDLMKKYRVPLEQVRPHRAVTEGTDCPGPQFPWQEFVRMIAAGLR